MVFSWVVSWDPPFWSILGLPLCCSLDQFFQVLSIPNTILGPCLQFSLSASSLTALLSVLVHLYSSSKTTILTRSCCLLTFSWSSIQTFSWFAIIGRLLFPTKSSYPATIHIGSDTRLVKIWWINLVTNPFLTYLANSIFQSGEIHPCVLSGDQDFNLVITGSIWWMMDQSGESQN